YCAIRQRTAQTLARASAADAISGALPFQAAEFRRRTISASGYPSGSDQRTLSCGRCSLSDLPASQDCGFRRDIPVTRQAFAAGAAYCKCCRGLSKSGIPERLTFERFVLSEE